MKKIIKVVVFIICLALVFGIVYFLSEKLGLNSDLKAGPNSESGEIVNLITEIEEASGVVLSLRGDTSFDWIIDFNDSGVNKKVVSGSLYQIDDTTMAKYMTIEQFLIKNYKENINIAADGVAGGQRGFIVGSEVCLLSFKHNQLKKNVDAPTEVIGDSRMVKLECGSLN
jgi:hypothetical protein